MKKPHPGESKLALGTVQFGLRYGISNTAGQPSEAEVNRILRLAAANGIDKLDTAASYGDSEAVLGRQIDSDHPFKIVTKIPAFRSARTGREQVEEMESLLDRSLTRLKRSTVYGLLLHDASALLNPGGKDLLSRLRELQDRGKVEKVGVSIYDARQIDDVMALGPIDIVQCPVSILDQRLIRSGHLKALNTAGVEIHGRSAFLQGLLLMEPRRLPAKLSIAAPHLQRVAALAQMAGISMLQLALQYCLNLEELSWVLVGVNTEPELSGIVEAAKAPLRSIPDWDRIAHECALNDPLILNPSLWSQ